MPAALNQRAISRRPQQRRARDRFERVLHAAEKLLLEAGLSGFSIPELANRLGYSRASIYKYFPTPYAIFNELMERYLQKLETHLGQHARRFIQLPWADQTREIVCLASNFHNENPVGRLLILGGPVTDDSYRVREISIQRLGALARQLLSEGGFDLPLEPDVATLAVDIGTTCFRLSYFKHGTITPIYRDEAALAMTAYLARHVGSVKQVSHGNVA